MIKLGKENGKLEIGFRGKYSEKVLGNRKNWKKLGNYLRMKRGNFLYSFLLFFYYSFIIFFLQLCFPLYLKRTEAKHFVPQFLFLFLFLFSNSFFSWIPIFLVPCFISPIFFPYFFFNYFSIFSCFIGRSKTLLYEKQEIIIKSKGLLY